MTEVGKQFSGAHQGVRYEGVGVMGHPDDNNRFNDEPGQMHLESMGPLHMHRSAPAYVESGQHAQERSSDPLKWSGQMALPGMPKPAEQGLHRMRQANPALNDYTFSQKNESRFDIHDRGGKRVATMGLNYKRDEYDKGHHGTREINGIEVAPAHRGKNLGHAVYDYARSRGVLPLHSSERSESGEKFARETGGPTLTRTKGHGQDDYSGFKPNPDKV